MTEVDIISNSLIETLSDSDLQSVTVDIAEVIADSFISDGLFKDIPIIGTIIGLSKTAWNIRNVLLLKKILSFLHELNDINPSDRKKMIDKIDHSRKYRMKIGEKLLYIIDKSDDHVTVQYVAKLFAAFIRNELDYSDFLKGSKIIEQIYLDDLIDFIKTEKKEFEPYEIENLLNTGLFAIYTEEISVSDSEEWKEPSDPYVVKGGQTKAYVTSIGEKIKSILSKSTFE